jgi:uncharacterized protein (TIGR03083 family)
MADHDRMRLQELASISECLHQLDDEQWDVASLCEGWRVRDVVSHMCVGYTTPMPTMLAKVARRRFNVPKASYAESVAFASARTPAEILAVLDEIHTTNLKRGIAKVIKPAEGLVDHLIHHQDIHHQDIRRPLGMPREMPADRLVAALDVVPGLNGFVGSKKRTAGLRLVAIDVDWTHGDGPEVQGTGEAILLVASGRPVALDELLGDGVGTLRDRLAA